MIQDSTCINTPEEKAAQTKWLAGRMTCPEPLHAMTDPAPCIEFAYIEHIKELGAKTSRDVIGSGRYTTDPPLQLPQGPAAALARRFLIARGYRGVQHHWIVDARTKRA